MWAIITYIYIRELFIEPMKKHKKNNNYELHLSSRPMKEKEKNFFITNSLDLYNIKKLFILYISSRVLVIVFIQYLFAEDDTYIVKHSIFIYIRKSINHFSFVYLVIA
jgi:hypothetical protein